MSDQYIIYVSISGKALPLLIFIPYSLKFDTLIAKVWMLNPDSQKDSQAGVIINSK